MFPRSTIGNRPYTEPEAGTPALDRYNHRIVELLDAQVSRPPVIPDDPAFALDLPRLKLTRQAKECWCEYHDEIERELGDGGRYAEIPDVGAKSAENVARLAAIDHVLADAGVPGEIDDETMERAVRVGRWYLDETRRALCIGEIAEVYADATLLSRWVGRRRNVSTFPPREVMRTGPAPLRHAERRDAALDLLVETNHLRRLDRGGRAIYCVNPRLLNFWRSR